MSCDRFKELMMGRLDGELSEEQSGELRDHLRRCEACREESEGFAALKEGLAMIEFKEPTDAELERYWRGIYNRLERGLGWVFFSLGAVVVLCYGAFALLEELFKHPKVALGLKIGVGALVLGVVVLFVSILRERLAVRKKDRYSKEVRR